MIPYPCKETTMDQIKAFVAKHKVIVGAVVGGVIILMVLHALSGAPVVQ